MTREDVVIPVPPKGAPWFLDGARFALTYDGYVRHGGFEGASQIGNSVRAAFEETGELPDELDILRCALFWVQRCIRWNEDSDPLRDGPYADYVEALLDQIRSVSGGAVPGPADMPP